MLSAYILLSLCTGACSHTAARVLRFCQKKKEKAIWRLTGEACGEDGRVLGEPSSWRPVPSPPPSPPSPPGVPASTLHWRRVCLGDSVRQLALSVRTHWSVQPQSATAQRLRLLSTKRSRHSLQPTGCDTTQKMNLVTCSSAFNS